MPAASTTSVRSPRRACTRASSARTCSRKPRPRRSVPGDQARIRRAGPRGKADQVARVPAGHGGRAFADRRDRQDRRPVLLLHPAQEAARGAAAVDADGRHRGRRINIVPVDFVAAALDHIAHKPKLDGTPSTSPTPSRCAWARVLNAFARAGHAPEMTMRIDARMFAFVPSGVRGPRQPAAGAAHPRCCCAISASRNRC